MGCVLVSHIDRVNDITLTLSVCGSREINCPMLYDWTARMDQLFTTEGESSGGERIRTQARHRDGQKGEQEGRREGEGRETRGGRERVSIDKACKFKYVNL